MVDRSATSSFGAATSVWSRAHLWIGRLDLLSPFRRTTSIHAAVARSASPFLGHALLLAGLVGCGGRSHATGSGGGGEAGGGDIATSGSNSGGVSGGGATAIGGSFEAAGTGSGGELEACQRDADCTANPCEACKNLPEGCPGSCQDGQCFYANCAQFACIMKECGAPCDSCFSPDGCAPGVCDRFGDCKPTPDSCDLGAPRSCAPLDATGAGTIDGHGCNVVQGWGWDGTKCVAIVGCLCEGSDCRALLADQTACQDAYRRQCK